MIYRVLGRTGLAVSLLSYGSGGPSRLGQSTGLSQNEQDTLIRTCLDMGINLFDTSVQYGDSERILGRALHGVERDSYYIATKWSPAGEDGVKDDPSELVASVENSLRLLGVSVLDIMQLHGVLPEHYDSAVERFYPTLEALRDSGKIRFIGITEQFFSDPGHTMLTKAVAEDNPRWDTIMLKYGILNQSASRHVLPAAKRHDVGVMNMASVRVKLTREDQLHELMGEWKTRGLIASDAVPDADALGWLVHGDSDSVISAGYKFAADHPAISTVITGTSRIEHLVHNNEALEHPHLPDADQKRLVALFGNLIEPV